MADEPPYRVMRFEDAGDERNPHSRGYSHWIVMLIDNAEHRIGLRLKTGTVHLPLRLMKHAQVVRIRENAILASWHLLDPKVQQARLHRLPIAVRERLSPT